MKNTSQTGSAPSSTRPGIRVIPSALLATLLLPSFASAQWTGAVNDQFNDTGNWTGGIINGAFSNPLGGNKVIQTTADITLPAGLNFSYSDNYSLRIETNGFGINHTLSLGGDLSVNVAGDASQNITLGSTSGSRPLTLDLGGSKRSFVINGDLRANAGGRDTLKVYSDITNGNLHKEGGGTLELYYNTSLTGDFVHTNGLSVLRGDGALRNINRLVVAGSLSRFTMVGSSAEGRLSQQGSIYMSGGILGFEHDNTTGTSIGTLHLSGARSAIGLTPGASVTTLRVNAIERDPYSTLSVVGSRNAPIGQGNARLTVTNDANILSSLSGGGGAAGTTTISILPWATAGNAISDSFVNALDEKYYGAEQGLVTYTSDGGFRALDKNTEYVAGINAAASSHDNVRLTASETLQSGKSINALYIDADATADLGGNTLKLESGVLAGTNSRVQVSNGTLDFGERTGYVMLGRNNSNAISARITGKDMVFASQLNLTLSANNTWTGRTVINSGTLVIAANNALPTGTDVRVDKTAALQIANNVTSRVASLSGNGLVQLGGSNAGLYIGQDESQSVQTSAITIGDGGVVTPGDASGYFQTDALTLAASTYFQSGSMLQIEIASASEFDSLIIQGDITVSAGATLVLSLLNGYQLKDGDSFQLISATGNMDSLANFTVDGVDGFTFNWVDGAIVASQIPEPATATALLAAAVIAGCVVTRLRQRR